MIVVRTGDGTQKNVKHIGFAFTKEKEPIEHIVIEEPNLKKKLNEVKEENKELFNSTKRVLLHSKLGSFDYIKLFENMFDLHISGSKILEFPNLKSQKKLEQVYIDSFNKPTSLKNLSTISNLRELHIGTFTFNGPVKIESFDEILNCKKLEKLILSYSKFDEEQLKRIVNMKSLKEIGIHQRIETETLAYLSVKMPNLKSNEFSAWQKCNTPWGDVKINGKRKPYLYKDKDSKKIKKYEMKFEELKNKYAL